MNNEYLQVSRELRLGASGGGDDVVDVVLESGTPYRHAAIFVIGEASNIRAQPKFGEINDGSFTNISGIVAEKIFQMPIDEIRPATRNLSKHPGDQHAPTPIKTSITITNNAASPANIGVYITAAAAPGGS